MSLKREREEWQGEDENGGNLMYVAGLRNDYDLRGCIIVSVRQDQYHRSD